MISHLRGSIHRLDPGEVSVDIEGVGYRVSVPLDTWDELKEGEPAMLWISAYIREDRFDLYGFHDRASRTLFEEFLKITGIGPKIALELIALPRGMLQEAISESDVKMLSSIKGIGKKTAEKLLVELRSLSEKKPGLFTVSGGPTAARRHEYDQDAIAALTALGYEVSTVTHALKELPADLKSTEERVAAALRNL
jgi:Holliday junction DNA helicase RuvA